MLLILLEIVIIFVTTMHLIINLCLVFQSLGMAIIISSFQIGLIVGPAVGGMSFFCFIVLHH